MASGPTSWQIDGETVETEADFIFLGSKITVDGDCSHEIKRCLLLGRKFMTNLDSLLKGRDIILPTKVHLVNAMVFPMVMYGCESWIIKKAESWRIDAFELCVVLEKTLLRVPWTARRSNQSILKEISPGCSLAAWCWSWNSNTLATWCKELTHLKRPWCCEGFPCSSVSKESACSAGGLGSIPRLGKSPGEGNGNPLQYPCWKSHGQRSLVG